MTVYEIKRILRNRKVICICFFVILVNTLLFGKEIFDIKTDLHYKTKTKILQQYGGTITDANMAFVDQYYEKLAGDISSGNLDISENSYYYSGYEFTDYCVMQQLKQRMDDIQEFRDKICGKIDQFEHQKRIYMHAGNTKKAREMEDYKELISQREIDVLQDDSIFLLWNSFRWTGVLGGILVCFVSCFWAQHVRYKEVEQATVLGERWNAIFQNQAVLTAELILYVVLEFIPMCYVLISLGRKVFDPLYYIQGFEFTFFNGTILSYMILTGVIRCISVLVVGDVFFWISNRMKTDIGSMGLCVGILWIGTLLLPYSGMEKIIEVNPLNGLSVRRLFQNSGDGNLIGQICVSTAVMCLGIGLCKACAYIRGKHFFGDKYVSN